MKMWLHEQIDRLKTDCTLLHGKHKLYFLVKDASEELQNAWSRINCCAVYKRASIQVIGSENRLVCHVLSEIPVKLSIFLILHLADKVYFSGASKGM